MSACMDHVGYYDYQFSKAGQKFIDQVLTFKFCGYGQLASFPVATHRF